MILYEYEAKKLGKLYGIPIPEGTLISHPDELSTISPAYPLVVKAQMLGGGRGKKGLIIPVKDSNELSHAATQLFAASTDTHPITHLLIESYLYNKRHEFYLSFTYDTESRAPVLLFSPHGGVDIESENTITKIPLNPREGFFEWTARQVLSDQNLTSMQLVAISKVLKKMYTLFLGVDARLLEINPLIETEDDEFYAADMKVILDDDADFRRADLGIPPRNELGYTPTQAELNAKEIDKNDHRGSAGSSYIELDGDIAIIAAGGGGSLVNMDTLISLGGKPANYTEHSGNPPAEKLEKLTKIILSKPGLHGCWVVGATANFTDIYETMRGFLDGLATIKPKPEYPIVIRRGGPRYEEAFVMLKEAAEKEGYNIHVYGPETPMTSTAKILLDLVDEYKHTKGLH